MKLDLLVYGRGQERLEGYQLFAAPSYWSDDMLIAMGAFNDLWTQGDMSDTETAAFAAEENPWGKSYIFVYMNEPYCCAFLRCTRVEGDTPGTWLKEARNFDIWSMEGVCCPFEQREQFFAMIPSIILWFEQDNTSLYRRLKDGKIGNTVEIPNNLIYNPYTFNDKEVSDDLLNIIQNENARNTWQDLCARICFSPQPFYFLYGPLADCFAQRVSANYGITEVFSTLDTSLKDPDTANDPLKKMENITIRKNDKKRRDCELAIAVRGDKSSGFARKWRLMDKKTGEKYLESRTIRADEDNSFDILLLEAEGMAIREFARKMNWEVSSESAEAIDKYTFSMEE